MEQSTPSDLLISQPELSPLEQEVLDEYERLAENMKKVSYHPPEVVLLSETNDATVGRDARRPSQQTDDGDPGRVAGAGEEDEFGVYAVEGECVLYCAAAGDLLWGGAVRSGWGMTATHALEGNVWTRKGLSAASPGLTAGDLSCWAPLVGEELRRICTWSRYG